MNGLEEIKNKLESFKKRYYIRQIALGIIGFLILNSVVFLGISGLEHQFWLGITGRTILFFSFLILILASAFFLFIRPLLMLFHLNKGLSDENAANEITKHFPEIEDKLLNALQLGLHKQNDLLIAAIEKKSADFKRLSFIQAVDFKPVRKYGIILSTVIIAFTLVSFINPSIITESPKRIANFKKEFTPEAPFRFIVLNQELQGFRGEDFTLEIQIEGEQLPEAARILITGENSPRVLNLSSSGASYTFPKLQSNKEFRLEATGFRSKTYQLKVNDRPDLVSMIIRVTEPAYTGGKRRTIENTGDLTLLEGSSVLWQIKTLATDSAKFNLNGEKVSVSRNGESEFAIEDRILKSGGYEIELFNEFSKNVSELGYSLDVITDEYPEIVAEYFPDSVTYQSVTLAGSISDDYGFSQLNINYRKNKQSKYSRIPLEINKSAGSQSYFAHWTLDTIDLLPGETIELYMSVLDNDGVHGPKETKAPTLLLKAPSEDEISDLISEKQDGVEDQLDNSAQKAEEIADRLEKLEEKLKSEQKFDWQEKKLLNDVIEDREKLAEDIEKLKKQHQELIKANNQFQKQSLQTQEKNQKMQELLDQLMNEETRELYEKLKELMKENAPSDQISQQLNQLKKNEQNLERDLERAMELFKRLKMESALEQNLQKLDTLSQQQENAAENSEDDISAQEEINKEFDEFREKMDEIQKLNQELNRPEAMEDFELEERQIAKELRDILEQMEKERQEMDNQEGSQNSEKGEGEQEKQDGQGEQQQNQNSQKPQKGSKQKQKSAAQKMKNLSKKLSNMQGGMQMEMMQANLDQLRDILDNLVKLSFNQEEIMIEMREVNQSDPRFLELSQNQLKLKDDAKVIQDSLLSLASKVVQISSYVTREVGSINENIDEAIDYLKDRNRGRALSSQQFAMTSINNLALLLDDTMQQMQMSMSEAMGSSSSGDKKQPQGMPDLQELQNQLGERINELKGSGKSGRELSEELARIAAEQEMIRRQMEMLKEAQDGKPGGGLGGDDMKRAIDMMEQNEVDLVNKRLTQQLINRQKQIVTRMLEAEKAQRDQEMDEEREADRPSVISREIPPGFEKYLELKKKEIELLKTIPIELNQFYKKEVNDYFRRLSSDEKND
ncbi:DUF4175 family protein [Ekhidna sp. To15]|uniref:DUF4175 family protein n=1 Tax=Ekhidna sp. To15 TaxID=3395267 RepID=UPI003F5235F9